MNTNLNKDLSVKKGRILKTVVNMAVGLALLLLGDATARAADMCFLDDFGYTVVGKNFAFPAAGACKSFDGYELGTNCIVSGTACGTSDNGFIRFHLTNSCNDINYQGISSFRIERFTSGYDQAGYGYSYQINGGYTFNWHNKTVPCPNPHPLN
jgi:hypothetical protein